MEIENSIIQDENLTNAIEPKEKKKVRRVIKKVNKDGKITKDKITKDKVSKNVNNVNNVFKIPELSEYESVTNKLLIPQLKMICRHYKLKVSGKKDELVERVRKFLHYSHLAIILQSKVKRRFTHEWLKLHGIGLFDRSICVNDSDIMGDDLIDIKYTNFFSFTDQGFTYGFDILTFKEMILKTKKDRITRERKVINPYTRDEIEDNVISDFYKLLKYTKCLFSKIIINNVDNSNNTNNVDNSNNVINRNRNRNRQLNINALSVENVNSIVNGNINVNVNMMQEINDNIINEYNSNYNPNSPQDISLNLDLLEDNEGVIYTLGNRNLMVYTQETHTILRNNNQRQNIDYIIVSNNTIESCITNIFHKIDDLGHYTNPEWFFSLTIPQLRTFIRDIKEIFDFRAGISTSVKRNILPDTNGTLEGSNINLNNWLNRQDNIWMLRSKALNYMIKLVTKGITDEYRSLGAFYVLTALTLSSSEAANAMPWLYQSAI